MYFRIKFEIIPMRAIHEFDIDTEIDSKAVEALESWADDKDVQIRIMSTELLEF